MFSKAVIRSAQDALGELFSQASNIAVFFQATPLTHDRQRECHPAWQESYRLAHTRYTECVPVGHSQAMLDDIHVTYHVSGELSDSRLQCLMLG